MKQIKSILVVISLILYLSPLSVFATQFDLSLKDIVDVSSEPFEPEKDDRLLNILKISSSATGCPTNSLFGQQYDIPTDTIWRAATSDNGATGSILVYDNFVNTGSINRISFWGINAYYNDGIWFVCFETPMQFQIRIFTDEDGHPGTQVQSYEVECIGYQTGLIYWGVFELFQYYADLPEPIEISEGWISIQGRDGNPECWFEWMSSSDGYDDHSLQWDGTTVNNSGVDRAFCLQHQEYLCGDIDGDGSVNFFDIIYFIYYRYKGGPPPTTLAMVDANSDGFYNILDVIYILNFLYKNGPAPGCF